MRGSVHAVAVSFVVLVVGSVVSTSYAQAQKSKPAPKAAPETDGTDVSNAPEALRGRSVVVRWIEIRTARPDGGGPASTRRVPYELIVYISGQKRAFNRLTVASAGSSDQVRGKDAKGKSAPTKDRTGFAQRTVTFDGLKLSVSNTFGGGRGFRDITATFDEQFSKCSGNVTVTIEGEYARQTKMSGGFEELLSSKSENFACFIQDGNALAS